MRWLAQPPGPQDFFAVAQDPESQAMHKSGGFQVAWELTRACQTPEPTLTAHCPSAWQLSRTQFVAVPVLPLLHVNKAILSSTAPEAP
jgi:hypothetical protein